VELGHIVLDVNWHEVGGTFDFEVCHCEAKRVFGTDLSGVEGEAI
jgi:hypothetical protein